ncbi:hypothetical protein LC613_18035 [Nostoc sphaeroides CHAB 2801]|uniref:hypothetical protein n=1 Tax=Nostoc sphaeroides TaxID=446679 RepID=UPI001C7050EB|nr:hypothetical protein [Nostoc sphaeroides]MCC5629838.1 hypothetical protein [Nostoc sphaeroides CHAB 2801]
MTVDGSRVFSQQSTVNSQRLECGIIYFLQFPRKMFDFHGKIQQRGTAATPALNIAFTKL